MLIVSYDTDMLSMIYPHGHNSDQAAMWPNQSRQATRDGVPSSAFAVDIIGGVAQLFFVRRRYDMKTQTTTSKRERLAKWQDVHSRLFRDDAQFRKRHISFLITIVCLSIPLLAVYGYYFGVGMTSFAANLSVIFCVPATMIFCHCDICIL